LSYIGYFIEWLSRDRYVVAAKLRDSLFDVRQLSGLLPICAAGEFADGEDT